jgi:hypothetical protein
MNNLKTKEKKAIQEALMEVQSITLEHSDLLQKQWRAMQRAQRLLGGNGDAEQLQLFK